MKEENLAAASGKCGQVGRCRFNKRIGGVQRCLVDVDFRCCGVRAKEAAIGKSKKSRREALCGDARVEQEAWIHLDAMRILWTLEGLLDGRNLLGRDASFALAGLAGQLRRIEIASERIKDHSIPNTIACIAPFHQRVHEELAVAV